MAMGFLASIYPIIRNKRHFWQFVRECRKAVDKVAIQSRIDRWLVGVRGSQQMKPAECFELVRLVLDTNPDVVVEIGSFNGVTSKIIGEALCCNGEKGRLFCIDPFETLCSHVYYGSRYTTETLKYNYELNFDQNTAHFGDRIVKLRGTSDSVALVENFSPDIVFVDGDHSREGVERDILRFLPLIPVGGHICFHDFTIGRSGVIAALQDTFWPAPNGDFFRIVLHVESLLIVQKKQKTENPAGFVRP